MASQSRDFGLNHGAGKGDAPRNVGPDFASNYEEIAWPIDMEAGFTRTGNRLRKVYRLLAVAGLSFLFTGCESYKACPYTPSAVHVGTYRTRDTGEYSDCVTLTWALK